MEGALDPVSSADLARLHRITLRGPDEVLAFLRRVHERGCLLSSGINRRNDSRTATLQDVQPAHITLLFENLEETHLPQLFLTCELDQHQYFFAVTPVERDSHGHVRALLPQAIYQTERRDLERISGPRAPSESLEVEIHASTGDVFPGVIADSCYHGLGVLLPAHRREPPHGQVVVQFLNGSRAGEQAHGLVRHRSKAEDRQGWVKIGLAVSDVQLGQPVVFEQRDQILALSPASRLTHHASLIRNIVKAASVRTVRRFGISARAIQEPNVIAYPSAPGQEIRAIVDSWGDSLGATAIVIPPAWGRSKETLSPLAATIVETFRSARQPVTVLRFDGTHRRGESYIPPDLRHPGAEYLRFTFSRAVKDIHATFEFLRDSPVHRPSKIVLVTFSLAAVEGRRAIATDPTGLASGWISVVGMVDLQTALKTISGGIDFAYGLSRGVRFGHHELVGVVADMDHTGLDALSNGLVFLEDARRDMARISVPITWIHGRHDAWMDVDRARHLMSCGETSQRRVIEVPTGHQLRTSAEAFAVFGLVATEVARMTSGRRLPPRIPDMADVDAHRNMERNRIPRTEVPLKEFWTRYLLGRDARLGFQLLTATSVYRRFMQEQIDALRIGPGHRVLDLGSGTGDFAIQLATEHDSFDVYVDAADFVKEALRRATARISALRIDHRLRLDTILTDFNIGPQGSLPFRPESYDAVLASLVISYLSDPLVLLKGVYAALKPRGRLVLSTLKRDADFSGIHLDGLAELRAGRAEAEFGRDAAEAIDEIARGFLNDASRILDLEEQGTFRFWDLAELAALAEASGFRVERSFHALGDPPQASVLVARRD